MAIHVASQIVIVADVDSERSIDYAESQYYVVLTGLCGTGCV